MRYSADVDKITTRWSAKLGRVRAKAGVLRQRNVGRQRYRVFEAPDVLNLFTGLERALASPTGDTTGSRPVRPVSLRPEGG